MAFFLFFPFLIARSILAVARDHYEGTPYSLTEGLAAGPYGDPNRWDVGASGNMTARQAMEGEFARAISLFRTSQVNNDPFKPNPNPPQPLYHITPPRHTRHLPRSFAFSGARGGGARPRAGPARARVARPVRPRFLHLHPAVRLFASATLPLDPWGHAPVRPRKRLVELRSRRQLRGKVLLLCDGRKGTTPTNLS